MNVRQIVRRCGGSPRAYCDRRNIDRRWRFLLRDTAGRWWLVWRVSQDGRSLLVSGFHPRLVLWWLLAQLWSWLAWHSYWPVLRFCSSTGIVTAPDGVCWQWRDWRSFTLRPTVILRRHPQRDAWLWDERDRLRARIAELERDSWKVTRFDAACDLLDETRRVRRENDAAPG